MTWTERAGGLIFDEDFDRPPPDEAAREPEIIEPVFSAAELAEARADGWQEGHDTAKAEADSSNTALARKALTAISEAMDTAHAEGAAIAEEAADAIARLLMDTFAAAFPALCVRHGDEELKAVVRSLLPCLQEEPKITIRVEPHMAFVLTEELEVMDPDLLARVRIIPTDAVSPGDVRIAWRAGGAKRDSAGLWAEIENVLAPSGLLSPQSAKEIAHVE